MNRNDYPYLPQGREYKYVGMENEYMRMAKEYAEKYKSNLALPAAAVVIKGGEVLGIGSIGNNSAHIKGCERVRLNMPTGQGYELCEGCSPENHSEARAILEAQSAKRKAQSADLYLWGHWWCCEPCWKTMISAGIKNVYLLKNSEVLFNKSHPDNIIGKQFD